jgi:hypothetical protein
MAFMTTPWVSHSRVADGPATQQQDSRLVGIIRLRP